MLNGKSIFRIEYEFNLDENNPDLRSEDEIRKMFVDGWVANAIKEELCSWVFDCEHGKCNVTMDHFEMKQTDRE